MTFFSRASILLAQARAIASETWRRTYHHAAAANRKGPLISPPGVCRAFSHEQQCRSWTESRDEWSMWCRGNRRTSTLWRSCWRLWRGCYAVAPKSEKPFNCSGRMNDLFILLLRLLRRAQSQKGGLHGAEQKESRETGTITNRKGCPIRAAFQATGKKEVNMKTRC